MPYRKATKGDEVFIRATVLWDCSDAYQVQIADYPNMVMTVWVPVSEVAKAEDIGRLLPRKACAS